MSSQRRLDFGGHFFLPFFFSTTHFSYELLKRCSINAALIFEHVIVEPNLIVVATLISEPSGTLRTRVYDTCLHMCCGCQKSHTRICTCSASCTFESLESGPHAASLASMVLCRSCKNANTRAGSYLTELLYRTSANHFLWDSLLARKCSERHGGDCGVCSSPFRSISSRSTLGITKFAAQVYLYGNMWAPHPRSQVSQSVSWSACSQLQPACGQFKNQCNRQCNGQRNGRCAHSKRRLGMFHA